MISTESFVVLDWDRANGFSGEVISCQGQAQAEHETKGGPYGFPAGDIWRSDGDDRAHRIFLTRKS